MGTPFPDLFFWCASPNAGHQPPGHKGRNDKFTASIPGRLDEFVGLVLRFLFVPCHFYKVQPYAQTDLAQAELESSP